MVTIGSLENKGEELAFTRERRKLGGTHAKFSLAGLLLGKEKFFLWLRYISITSSCWGK